MGAAARTASGPETAGFRLRLLGPLSVSLDEAAIALPKSKKTRALLVYLALAREPVRRERLCELFWDAPDDPRGSLRWSLSKLRPIVNAGGAERLRATAETVAWEGRPDEVDLHAIELALAAGADRLSSAQLAALASAFHGELADGLDLPEHDIYQRWLTAERERVRRIRASILHPLLDRLDYAPGDALPHANALVELAPYDETAHARLVTLHRRLGRDKESRQAYDAGLRALGELGLPARALDAAWRAGAAHRVRSEEPAREPPLSQEIRFCRAPDGVRLAYAVVGKGSPVVKTGNWLNHLEYDWESPVWRHVLRAFAREQTLVRYDARGNGLSDWNAEDLSLEARMADLETVIEATGLERFAMFGVSQGCALAIEYAVRYPERVTKLVLYGGFAMGWAYPGGPHTREQGEAMVTLMRSGWGRDTPAFRQLFTSLFLPEGTPEQFHWCNELQRLTASGETAARLMVELGKTDVRDRLARVVTPTIVLHVRDDAAIRFSCGRDLAAGIPGARFVPLEGRNHLFLEHEPAWPRFWEEVSRFLAEA